MSSTGQTCTVCVHIIEVRGVPSPSSTMSSDLYAEIRIGPSTGSLRRTRIVTNKNSCVWNERFNFKGIVLGEDEFKTEKIGIRIFNRNWILFDNLIGECEFSLSTVHRRTNHEYFRVWQPLIHPKYPADDYGWINLSCYVLRENDIVPTESVTGSVFRSQESYLSLNSPGKNQSSVLTTLNVFLYSIEDCVATNSYRGRASPFLSVRFNGTSIQTPQYNQQDNLVCKKIIIPFRQPLTSDAIELQVWNSNTFTPAHLIGEAYVSYIETQLDWRPFGPRWVNLYSSQYCPPEISRLGKIYDDLDGSSGAHNGKDEYVGRVLMRISSRTAREDSVARWKEPAFVRMKDCQMTKQPPEVEYTINITLHAADIPVDGGFVFFDAAFGRQRSKSSRQRGYRGLFRWGEELKPLRVRAPRDLMQVHDIIINAYHMNGSIVRKIFYLRIPPLRLVAEGTFDEDAQRKMAPDAPDVEGEDEGEEVAPFPGAALDGGTPLQRMGKSGTERMHHRLAMQHDPAAHFYFVNGQTAYSNSEGGRSESVNLEAWKPRWQRMLHKQKAKECGESEVSETRNIQQPSYALLSVGFGLSVAVPPASLKPVSTPLSFGFFLLRCYVYRVTHLPPTCGCSRAMTSEVREGYAWGMEDYIPAPSAAYSTAMGWDGLVQATLHLSFSGRTKRLTCPMRSLEPQFHEMVEFGSRHSPMAIDESHNPPLKIQVVDKDTGECIVATRIEFSELAATMRANNPHILKRIPLYRKGRPDLLGAQGSGVEALDRKEEQGGSDGTGPFLVAHLHLVRSHTHNGDETHGLAKRMVLPPGPGGSSDNKGWTFDEKTGRTTYTIPKPKIHSSKRHGEKAAGTAAAHTSTKGRTKYALRLSCLSLRIVSGDQLANTIGKVMGMRLENLPVRLRVAIPSQALKGVNSQGITSAEKNTRTKYVHFQGGRKHTSKFLDTSPGDLFGYAGQEVTLKGRKASSSLDSESVGLRQRNPWPPSFPIMTGFDFRNVDIPLYCLDSLPVVIQVVCPKTRNVLGSCSIPLGTRANSKPSISPPLQKPAPKLGRAIKQMSTQAMCEMFRTSAISERSLIYKLKQTRVQAFAGTRRNAGTEERELIVNSCREEEERIVKEFCVNFIRGQSMGDQKRKGKKRDFRKLGDLISDDIAKKAKEFKAEDEDVSRWLEMADSTVKRMEDQQNSALELASNAVNVSHTQWTARGHYETTELEEEKISIDDSDVEGGDDFSAPSSSHPLWNFAIQLSSGAHSSKDKNGELVLDVPIVGRHGGLISTRGSSDRKNGSVVGWLKCAGRLTLQSSSKGDWNDKNTRRMFTTFPMINQAKWAYQKNMKINVRLFVFQGINLAPSGGGSETGMKPYLCVYNGTNPENHFSGRILVEERLKKHKEESYSPMFDQLVQLSACLPYNSVLNVEVWDKSAAGVASDRLVGALRIDLERRILTGNRRGTKEMGSLKLPGRPESQGKLAFQLDLLRDVESRMIQTRPSQKPARRRYEFRVVLWRTEGVKFFETKDAINFGTRGKDNVIDPDQRLEITSNFDAEPGYDAVKHTDTAWHASGGNADWNWRLVYHIELPCKNPRLTIAVWDENIITDDISLGEVSVNFSSFFQKAVAENLSSSVFKRQRFPFEHPNSISGPGALGYVTLEAKLVSEAIAETNPVGEAQKDPNRDPYLAKPKRNLAPWNILSSRLGYWRQLAIRILICCAILVLVAVAVALVVTKMYSTHS